MFCCCLLCLIGTAADASSLLFITGFVEVVHIYIYSPGDSTPGGSVCSTFIAFICVKVSRSFCFVLVAVDSFC